MFAVLNVLLIPDQIVPLYIAEISPARFRGRMISVDMICLGTGSVLAYAVDAIFAHVAHGWRYMVGLGAVPSIVLGIFLFWCPESPRQLMYHNKREECVRVVRKIYSNATEEQIANKVATIEYGVSQSKALDEEQSVRKSLQQLFCVPANLRAGIAACGLMFFQQCKIIPDINTSHNMLTSYSLWVQYSHVFQLDPLRHCWVPQPRRCWYHGSLCQLDFHCSFHLPYRPCGPKTTPSLDHVGHAIVLGGSRHRFPLGSH